VTTVNETWTHADAASSLTADQPWTLFSGTTWGIVSNQAQNSGFEGGTTELARCDTPVSTSDHEVAMTLKTLTYAAGFTCNVGLLCRKDNSGTFTCYFARADKQNNRYDLQSVVSGSATLLGTGGTPAVNDVMRLQALGSAITLFINNVSTISVTDTAVPSGTFGGLISFCHGEAGDIMAVDDWSLTDVGGAPPPPPGRPLTVGTNQGGLTTVLTG
jgi:hypothetical protein